MSLTPEAMLAIGVVVAGATELVKRFGNLTGISVLLVCASISIIALFAWGVTYEPAFNRTLIWPYVAAWVGLTTTATGMFEVVKAVVRGNTTNS